VREANGQRHRLEEGAAEADRTLSHLSHELVASVSQIVADALEDMKLEMPKPTVDLKEIRRLDHQVAASEGVQASEKRRSHHPQFEATP